ncbi:hypothetical protein AVEN_55116-1 [Araneus ventricosus]|uniref:Uncharacterized protein n=1 Tax=Araneus ventricosus TaxID=182803 RepID=A0A4Y2T8V6_ARAVE|nr:hypothetical protein AVEN_55116-1 [Araneus ventricosus]
MRTTSSILYSAAEFFSVHEHCDPWYIAFPRISKLFYQSANLIIFPLIREGSFEPAVQLPPKPSAKLNPIRNSKNCTGPQSNGSQIIVNIGQRTRIHRCSPLPSELQIIPSKDKVPTETLSQTSLRILPVSRRSLPTKRHVQL